MQIRFAKPKLFAASRGKSAVLFLYSLLLSLNPPQTKVSAPVRLKSMFLILLACYPSLVASPRGKFSPSIEKDDEPVSIYSGSGTYPALALNTILGSNISIAKMVEKYGTISPEKDEGRFLLKDPGFQIGAGLSVLLIDNLELHLDGVYTYNSFTYSNLQHGFAQINKKEIHHRIEIPLSFTLSSGRERWRPYIRLGTSIGMLLTATADFERTFVNTGSAFYSPLKSWGVNIEEKRNEYLLSIVGGGGISYLIDRRMLFLDLRYYYAISDIVVPAARWDPKTAFSFYYADSDFMLDYFAISIGYRFMLNR